MLRFVDLFAGLGGFHVALASEGHRCVFASEIDRGLRQGYRSNFPEAAEAIHGDLRQVVDSVPPHDVLCAGFPCQPFSKSGDQAGFQDATRGTLFHEILKIANRHRPRLILLENVGNFARHDGGRTWKVVRASLEALGYDVRGTEHRVDGGRGLISPHHFGHPHHRERFFAIAARWDLPTDPFPKPDSIAPCSLSDITLAPEELTLSEREETQIAAARVEAIDFWNLFLRSLPEETKLPSFPIWAQEIGAVYPFEGTTPYATAPSQLARQLGLTNGKRPRRKVVLQAVPPYARQETREFPEWKKRFIRQNREWFAQVEAYLPSEWLAQLHDYPHSLRKLEWNCQGESRDLWQHVLQFRPSGLRVKRYTSIPALVAMTTTQVPILGPERRHLTRREALRLQGFPDEHVLPDGRERSFAALGNAVHVKVVQRIYESLRSHAPGGVL